MARLRVSLVQGLGGDISTRGIPLAKYFGYAAVSVLDEKSYASPVSRLRLDSLDVYEARLAEKGTVPEFVWEIRRVRFFWGQYRQRDPSLPFFSNIDMPQLRSNTKRRD